GVLAKPFAREHPPTDKNQEPPSLPRSLTAGHRNTWRPTPTPPTPKPDRPGKKPWSPTTTEHCTPPDPSAIKSPTATKAKSSRTNVSASPAPTPHTHEPSPTTGSKPST